MTEPLGIYPMVMFPTLAVADVAASVEWYTERVGFALVFSLPRPEGGVAMAHLRWRKYADLLLVPDVGTTEDGRRKGVGVVLSFLADSELVDEMAARLVARGVEIAEGPVTRPWNVRDIVVLDPDGYRLVFFAPVDVSRSFEDVMGDVSEGRAVYRMTNVQFGVQYNGVSMSAVIGPLEFARRMESLGFRSYFVPELETLPTLDPFVLLAAVAQHTERMRLGTGVAVLPFRTPYQMAKIATSIDVLSGGRMVLGLGSGGVFNDDFGVEGVRPEDRRTITDERLELVRRLLSEERVTHSGRLNRDVRACA